MLDFLNRSLPLAARCRALRRAAAARLPAILEALVTLAHDPDEAPEIRRRAVHGIARQDKRLAFPELVRLLALPDRSISRRAVVVSPLLRDTRSLFALVNLYRGLDLDDPDDLRLAAAVLKTGGRLRDPRAEEWLLQESTSPRADLAAAAARSLEATRAVGPNVLYTFNGKEDERLQAVAGASCRAVPVRDARQVVDERGYVLFVVLPGNEAAPFDAPCRMLVAPWRSEHFVAARGADVLAAGIIGFDGPRIVEITNQSGGYVPHPNSFIWARRALEAAGVALDVDGYTSTWPPEGFFEDGFRSRYPLWKP